MKYLLFLVMSTSVFAQYAEQPLPEDTEDARASVVVFEVKDLKNKRSFSLVRTPFYDHFIRYKNKKNERLQKADSKLSKQLDGEFSSVYFKTLYEIPSKKGFCQEVYRLSLRGEEQLLCRKDDQKTQMIKSFIELLEKQF